MARKARTTIRRDTRSDENAWKTVLIARMKAMEPAAFERLCQRLLREADFEKVLVTGRSGDGGNDGVGLVRLGLLSLRTYFQCKRYSGAVGSSLRFETSAVRWWARREGRDHHDRYLHTRCPSRGDARRRSAY